MESRGGSSSSTAKWPPGRFCTTLKLQKEEQRGKLPVVGVRLPEEKSRSFSSSTSQNFVFPSRTSFVRSACAEDRNTTRKQEEQCFLQEVKEQRECVRANASCHAGRTGQDMVCRSLGKKPPEICFYNLRTQDYQKSPAEIKRRKVPAREDDHHGRSRSNCQHLPGGAEQDSPTQCVTNRDEAMPRDLVGSVKNASASQNDTIYLESGCACHEDLERRQAATTSGMSEDGEIVNSADNLQRHDCSLEAHVNSKPGEEHSGASSSCTTISQKLRFSCWKRRRNSTSGGQPVLHRFFVERSEQAVKATKMTKRGVETVTSDARCRAAVATVHGRETSRDSYSDRKIVQKQKLFAAECQCCPQKKARGENTRKEGARRVRSRNKDDGGHHEANSTSLGNYYSSVVRVSSTTFDRHLETDEARPAETRSHVRRWRIPPVSRRKEQTTHLEGDTAQPQSSREKNGIKIEKQKNRRKPGAVIARLENIKRHHKDMNMFLFLRSFLLLLLAYSSVIFVAAFDVVTISHRAQVVKIDIAATCPCESEELPCYDASAAEGEVQCKAPIFTVSEIASAAANGQVLLRCGTLLDCIEVKLVSENQQQQLVPKQLLERSRLSQFRYETAPVLDSYGIETTQKNRIEYSRWTYIGCFSAQDVTADHRANPPAQAYDPNACIEFCTGPGGMKYNEYYEQQKQVTIGISKLSCACVVESMQLFTEDKFHTMCTQPCLPSFSNPLCGGDGDAQTDYWGLFMEYEFQSFGSSGAYDVWRYMWYTVVVIKDSTIDANGQLLQIGAQQVVPERYYLHCANEQGAAVFQNQIQIRNVMLYGLEYDTTGSRLVALALPNNVGRTPVVTQNTDDKWRYRLTTVEIDETDRMYPKLTQVEHELNDENLQSLQYLYRANSQAQDNLVFTGVSCIISGYIRSYAITQVDKNDKRNDRFFLFSMQEDAGTGGLARVKLIHQQPLGFKALQLYGNTRYGTISCVGPMNGDMMYVVLGYLFEDDRDPNNKQTRWTSYYDESNKATGRYFGQQIISGFHVYPGGGASGPRNSTFLSYRNYPESVARDRPRLETAYSVLQINAYSGSTDKWCQVEACETGDLHRSIDPDVPYANLFNAEAGFPLVLSAPKIEHARFTIEGLFLRIVFNMETTRGAIPIDTDGNRLPDRLDQTKDRSGGAKFDCAEVLVPETIALIGTYPETSCVWKDDVSEGGGETLEVEFGTMADLKLGDEIELLADRVFAKPECRTPGDFSTCEFSPAAVGEGAVVSLPHPLLAPVVSVVPKDGTFSIDSCGSITLKADETKRTGRSAVYLWELDDSDGVPYVSLNTVSSAMNQTRYAILQQRMAETTTGTLEICVECMPQGFRYNMKVSVTSEWGMTSTLAFVIEKADYPAPTIRTGSWSSPTNRLTSQAIRIDTEIRQSECAVGDQQLSCNWECESHNPDWTPNGVSTTMECDNSLFEPEKLQFPVYGQTLGIPRYTFAPPTYSADDMAAGLQKFHEYRFRIVCVVVQSATDVVANTETQQGQNAAEVVVIRVERAPLKVLLFPSGTEFPQKGTTMALNARFTMDPDLEEVYPCLLDPGSLACSTLPDFGYSGDFTFRCWKVTPAVQNQGAEIEAGDTVCPGNNYVVKDVNTVCAEGSEILDAVMCETAANECGPYTWNPVNPDNPGELGGCFFRTNENDVQYNGFAVRTIEDGMADRRPICWHLPTAEVVTTTPAGTTEVTASGTTMSPCFTLNLGPGASPNGVYQTLTNGNIDDWKLRDYTQSDVCTQKGGENVPGLEIGYSVTINQVTFKGGDPEAIPPVLPECYCYYNEGLLLVETNKMTLSMGEEFYTFHVTAVHEDGRRGTDTVDVNIVDRIVLQVFLKEVKLDPDLALLPLTSVYQDVVLEGSITRDPNLDGAIYEYRWEIYKKQSGGNVYVTEWKNETDTFTWDDQSIIEWDASRTSRITFHLDPNSNERPLSTQLQKSTSYKMIFHVTARVPGGQYQGTYFGKAQRVVHTAPGPPIRGGFTVKPQAYTFPDDLLTNADFGRIPHSSPITYEFDAPQWRADSTGSNMDADLSYSFGFTPVQKDGTAAATIWQVEDQSSTYFEVNAHQVAYDGQDTLIANLKVCTVYKVCATGEVTMAMNYNDQATYEEIKFALLGDGLSAVDPQKVVAAQITADGIQGRLTPDQYDELQGDFRDSVKRFDFGGMDTAELGSALQATSSATGSVAGIEDQSEKNAQISDLLDTTGSAMDSFLAGPISADGARALIDVFSNILSATGGQGDASGVSPRRQLGVVKLLSEYEDEFGEDLLETLEDAVRREEADARRRLGLQKGSSSSDEEDHNLDEKETRDEKLTYRTSKDYDLSQASETEIRELHADVANVLTPTEIADLFSGRHLTPSSGGRQQLQGAHTPGSTIPADHATSTVSSGTSSRTTSATNWYQSATVERGPSVGNAGTKEQDWRIAEKYGRRYSRKEFEKRLRILKRLDELHYYIPASVADGAVFGRQAWEKFRHATPRISPGSYLISDTAMRALERAETKSGEFGSPLVTHRPRKRAGLNHEHPPPRQLFVQKGLSSSGCDFCGVYHTPFPLTDAVTGKYEPYAAYGERDMKFLMEKPLVVDDYTGEVRDSAFTLTWNRTHSVYQIVDARRRRIVAQTTNTLATRDGKRVRLLSADDLMSARSSRNSTSRSSTSSQEQSSSTFWSIFGATSSTEDVEDDPTAVAASRRALVSSPAREADSTLGGPLLLRHPEALEWAPAFVKLRAVPAVIHECPSSFCDDVGLLCFTGSFRAQRVGGPVWGKEHMRWQCCGEKNPETLCNQPPCWFAQKCPRPKEEVKKEFEKKQRTQLRQLRAEVLQHRSRTASSREGSLTDLLAGAPTSRRNAENTRANKAASSASSTSSSSSPLENTSMSRKLQARDERRRRLEEAIFTQEYQAQEYSRGDRETWFDRWMCDEASRNTTVGRMWKKFNWTIDNAPISFADRARAYELYHSSPQRQLQMAGALMLDQTTIDQYGQISFVEKYELPLLRDAKRMNLQEQIGLQTATLVDAKSEIEYNSLDPASAAAFRADDASKLLAERRNQMDTRRNISQAMTRLSLYRDKLVRALIPTLVVNARQPLSFDTTSFTMDVGRQTNMSAVSSAFVFPSEFIVPNDSPPERTATNNVTALAYQFIRYKNNIYYWSPSNPKSQESAVITLLMFYADAREYPVCVAGSGCNEGNEFIRVFADYQVYSSGVCLIWDRFFPDTAGGAWNGRDIINDGNGCLTLTLGDIGFFVDGRPSHIYSLTEASIFPLSRLVSRTKLSTFATLIILLLLNWMLVFLGYKQDEKVRSEQRQGVRPYVSYHLDGDGIHTPLTCEDPIAYKFAEDRNQLFVKTFWNVMKREHLAIGPLFYHETFTRPQRLLCTMTLIQGLLALNAAVYGNPNALASADQYVISGILSALLMFPVYCVFLLLFSQRPTPVKRRMIKRRAMNRDLDLINAEKEKLIAQSSMLPASALTQLSGGRGQALPIGNLAAHNENMSLLALPPPIASPSVVGRSGQLALPGPGPGGNPPAPKYPPPPGYAKALPPPQELLPPIYFNKAGMPQLPALPSFEPQAKAATPPAPPGVGGGGGTPLGGMRAISPRQAKPPPPALLPPGAGSPAVPPGPPPAAEGAHNAPEDFSADESSFSSDSEENGENYRNPEGAVPYLFSEDEISNFSGSEERGNSFSSTTGRIRRGESSAHSEAASVIDREDAEERSSSSSRSRRRHFQEGQHEMAPPPPPPPGGPPGAQRPPPPPRPPNLNLSGNMPAMPTYGSSFEPKTPSMPPPSARGFLPATPKGLPPIIPFGTMRPDTLIQRGQPPAFHPAPFRMPPPPGMGGMGRPPPPAGPGALTGYELALPGPPGAPPGSGFPPGAPPPGAGAAPSVTGVPLPPPPPREDDSAFVRRVRLIYMDRVMREHQKQELLELDAVGRPIPNWVFQLSTIMPYMTSAVFVLGCICVIMIYAIKFDSWQEEHWYYACIIGFFMVVFLLDVIRAAVITVVELRKFEIRKRSKAGEFVVRRVQKQDDHDSLPGILKPKPKHKASATPAAPKVAPKFANMERPRFLPEPPGGAPMMGGTYDSSFRTTGGGSPPPPPIMPPPGNRTPPPPGARTPPPGTPGRRTPPGGRGPNVPFGQASPMTRKQAGDVSPAGSNFSQTLQERRAMGHSTTNASQTAPGGGFPKPPPVPSSSTSPRSTTPPAFPRGSPVPGGSAVNRSGSRTPPRTPPK
ncbi:unnamed protein product [Amoebophrya sp. A120]|nr:unnamed protein product [Amoebophrya sp. A120]|eukprot:GSA120T00003621001.1